MILRINLIYIKTVLLFKFQQTQFAITHAFAITIINFKNINLKKFKFYLIAHFLHISICTSQKVDSIIQQLRVL